MLNVEAETLVMTQSGHTKRGAKSGRPSAKFRPRELLAAPDVSDASSPAKRRFQLCPLHAETEPGVQPAQQF